MKNFIVIILLICSHIGIFAQDCEFLELKKGFRNIVLGSSIKNYPEFLKRNEQNADKFKYYSSSDYFYVGKETDTINSIRILYIYLKVKEGNVDEITVVTERILSLFSILKNAYGESEYISDLYYQWQTASVLCQAYGDNNPRPGYTIIYKNTPQAYHQLNVRKKEMKRNAQNQL